MQGNIRLTMELPKLLRKSNGHSKFLHLFVFFRVIRGRIYICIFSGSKFVVIISSPRSLHLCG